ncbi:MAG TPA: hypothetical protein VJB96_04400 [Patescibacteria group bacterium]|nr:hypothetical protein [Patescibacteria group bacterium]
MKTMGVTAILLVILSFGFIDPNLPYLRNALTSIVYGKPVVAAVLYIVILIMFYVGYTLTLRAYEDKRKKRMPRWIVGIVFLLLLSYPAFSHDIFNYILTAKLTFFYQENPYVVMPIEILNEPMLAFTRAANKLALYGPTWIILTVFPYLAGLNNVLASIFSFKIFVAAFYSGFTYLIYRKTKDIRQTLFFALNPLVLIETLVSGHNDIVMMTLAIAGLMLWERKDMRYKATGVVLFVSSILVKGATIVLLPLFFFPTWKWEKKVVWGYWLMFLVFLLSPLREEMYPWYAVWWLAFAAFIPVKKNSVIHGFSYWLTFGLMLRYVPWIATREYGGITPLVREVVTLVPVGIYIFIHHVWRRFSLR